MPAFSSKSGIPFSDVNLHTHNAHQPRWGPDSSTAEVSTIQLEFKYLAKVTGDDTYFERANKVRKRTSLLQALTWVDGRS